MLTKKRKLGKRDHFKEKIFLALFIVFFLGLIGFLVFSNLRISRKRIEMRERIETLKEDIRILEKKNQELKAGIFQSESDLYWEEILRKHGYVAPGEEAIVIVPPEKEETIIPEEKAFLENLLDWVLMRD